MSLALSDDWQDCAGPPPKCFSLINTSGSQQELMVIIMITTVRSA